MKCPQCKKEFEKPLKEWDYFGFQVETYTCECGIDFREYKKEGKNSFMLKKTKKGRIWNKV